MPSKRLLGQVYLTLVPFLTAAFGFGVGHIAYLIYIPVWLVNMLLMALSAWALGAHTLRSGGNDRKEVARIGVVMIIPWVLFSIFFGMGPPPATIAGWLETTTEQQARYYILVIGGVVAGCGFALLAQYLVKAGEGFYGVLGSTLIKIAVPLFVLNMLYWGQFLPEAFRSFTDPASTERPAWYVAFRSLFYHIAVVEVALLYLATALFVDGEDLQHNPLSYIHGSKRCVYVAKCAVDGSARTAGHTQLYYIRSCNSIYYAVFNRR